MIKAQLLRGNANHFRMLGRGIPTGWAGGELFRGIRAFQKEKGLTADGILLPLGPHGVDENGVGETMMALRGDLGGKLAGYEAPTPQEVDAHYENEARFSGAPEGSDLRNPPSAILTYDENGEAEHPVGVKAKATAQQTVSDIDGPQQLPWQDGGRLAAAPVAQALQGSAVTVLPPGPAAPSTGGTPTSPYPHEPPDVKAAGNQLEKIVNTGLGNAAANMKRWHENARSALGSDKPINGPMGEAEHAAFTPLPHTEPKPTPPSRPLGEAEKAAAQTPPPMPPKVDDKRQGRPADAPQLPDEKLIPPKIKEGIGSLPPQQQPFAKDLTGILLEYNPHCSRGKPETVQSSYIAAQICQEVLKEFPRLEGIAHVKGSKNAETGNDQKEEVIKKEGAKGLTGSSRPDGTHVHETNKELVARFNTVDILKTESENIETETMTANELHRYNNLPSNIKKGVAGWARKVRPGESEESYRRNVEPRCRDMWK